MTLLIYLLKVSACQAIFFLFYRLVVRHDTHFNLNRVFLIASIPLSFVLPHLSQLEQLIHPTAPVYIVPISEFIYQAEVQATAISQNAALFPSLFFIKIFYGIGAILLLFRFLYGINKIYRIKNKSVIKDHETFKLALTEQDISPFSFLNTIYISQRQSEEGRVSQSVLNHELAHIQGRHTYDILLVEVVKIITWFNPVIYLIKNELKRTHEYIADQAVLNTGQLVKYYQQLIDQSISDHSLSLTLPFNKSNIKKRISMMDRNRSAAWKKYKYILVVPVIGLILSAFSLHEKSGENEMISSDHIVELDSLPVYKIADEMPRFPGCEEINGSIKEKEDCATHEMLQYIYSNIKYPAQAREEGIQGQIVISFIIEKDGRISAEKILRDIGGGLGEESLRVVRSMSNMPQKWTPGKDGGKVVRVQYNLPIKFKLEEPKDELNLKEESLGSKHLDKKKQDDKTESLKLNDLTKDEVFKIIEEMPRFPGCENIDGDKKDRDKCATEYLLKYIYSEITYPAQARENGVQGQVVITFIVEKNGDITDARILRDKGAGLGEEALRVVQTMNHMPAKWRAGHQRGVAVRTQYNLPVQFKLVEDEKDENSSVKDPIIKPSDKSSKVVEKSPPPPPPKPKLTPEVFKIVEQMPRFPGCEDIAGNNKNKNECASNKMLEYVYSNITYPAQARENGVQGQVVLSFVVEKNGDITEINILRDKGGGLGEEAARVIRSMNQMTEKWTPGMQRGKKVRVQYNFPIKFKLEGPVKEEVYKIVEQMPRFPGCENLSGDNKAREKCASNKLSTYLSSQIRYPRLALQEKMEGTVVVTFVVKKDGSIDDIKVLKDVGGGLGEESIRVINSMNQMTEKWTPGSQRGVAVNVRYNMPLHYKLPVNNNR